MRAWILSLALCVASAGSGHGQAFTSPRDLLQSLYQIYLANRAINDFGPYFSDRLVKEMQGARIGQQELRSLGFDPLLGAQRAQISMLDMNEVSEIGDTASVVVTFNNLGKPVTIRFDMVLEAGEGWQIDHMAGEADGRAWCTNDIISLTKPS